MELLLHNNSIHHLHTAQIQSLIINTKKYNLQIYAATAPIIIPIIINTILIFAFNARLPTINIINSETVPTAIAYVHALSTESS